MQANTEATLGLANDICIAKISRVELIHGIGADLGISQREELSSANGQSIETWDACSGHGTRIRIIEAVVVYEVLGRELAEAAVAIDAYRSLIIPDGLGERRCRKLV
jgi:hypothetical protein